MRERRRIYILYVSAEGLEDQQIEKEFLEGNILIQSF